MTSTLLSAARSLAKVKISSLAASRTRQTTGKVLLDSCCSSNGLRSDGSKGPTFHTSLTRELPENELRKRFADKTWWTDWAPISPIRWAWNPIGRTNNGSGFTVAGRSRIRLSQSLLIQLRTIQQGSRLSTSLYSTFSVTNCQSVVLRRQFLSSDRQRSIAQLDVVGMSCRVSAPLMLLSSIYAHLLLSNQKHV